MAAEGRIIETPADTIEELRTKLEVMFADPHAMPNDAERLAVLRDFHRLTDEPSRVFDPELWLARYEKLGGGWIRANGEIMLGRTLKSPNAERLEAHLAVLDRFDGGEAVIALIAERGRE